ncbi:hypothetical protein AVEN_251424-1 [Araneus ventricosus]|uniref:Uncharacterized protein n=1 Tax=Araneus ventricosus TaxID=182803 RepID=A0A4Y2FCE5_ARAVE|nr:hypothetical protein AVEN_251424-1 [Araneus ventricosus]
MVVGRIVIEPQVRESNQARMMRLVVRQHIQGVPAPPQGGYLLSWLDGSALRSIHCRNEMMRLVVLGSIQIYATSPLTLPGTAGAPSTISNTFQTL